MQDQTLLESNRKHRSYVSSLLKTTQRVDGLSNEFCWAHDLNYVLHEFCDML